MPSVERFEPRVLEREWGTETFVAQTANYLGKVLRMKAGTKGGLQYHVEKEETFYLFEGSAIVRADWDGKIVEVPMGAGESYHVPPGAVHQVEAVTNCIFFEASTPHLDDRVRVEEKYGLPADGGLPTTR
jgi:mannose-6-phosphate isomerase